MKKFWFAVVFAAILGFGGKVLALPVNVDVDGPGSSVGFTSYQQGATMNLFGSMVTFGTGSTLTVDLDANLDTVAFPLIDGQTSDWFNFLVFETTGSGIGTFALEATLAFETPDVGPATGAAGTATGGWGSVNLGFLHLLGGALKWDDSTIELTDNFGNNLVVELQDGVTIGLGTTTSLKARVTNNGGGTAPPAAVPEPATMVLFGLGLTGIGMAVRRKK